METPDRLPVLATDPPLTDEQLDRLAAWEHGVAELEPGVVSIDVGGPPFAIAEVGVADWAMRKVAEAQADIAKAELAAATWHNEIAEWLKRVTARAASSIAFLGHHLEQYALGERERSGDREKTVYLPAGEVRTRSDKPRVVVTDEVKLIEWCEANIADPYWHVVKVEKSILVSELRKHVEIKDDQVIDPLTGELVPGVGIEEGRTSAKVVPR